MTKTTSCVGALVLAALGAACGDDALIDFTSVGNGSGGSATSGIADAGGSILDAGPSRTDASAAGTGDGADASGVVGDEATVDASTGSEALDAGDPDASVVTPEPVTTPAQCAIGSITQVPYDEPWLTAGAVDDTLDIDACQACEGTGDYIVTFTAPAAATYRFLAISQLDAELAVFPGACPVLPDDISCGENVDEQDDHDDRLDLELAQGEVVTVVVSESCEPLGGTGTLRIEVAP